MSGIVDSILGAAGGGGDKDPAAILGDLLGSREAGLGGGGLGGLGGMLGKLQR